MADILIQRGTIDVGNTGSTDSLTAVSSLNNAFAYNSNNLFTQGGSTSSGGNMEADDMSGLVELTALDTVTLSRQANSLAQNMRFDWQVIEYTGLPGGANEFIVRSRNLITMSGNSGSAPLDTTPDNIDNCIPFITGVRTTQVSNNGDELRVAAYIDDSGTLQVRKGSTTNTTVVQVVTVEFTGSNWSVYHGDITSAADTGAITLNTDSDGAGGAAANITDWATALIDGGFTSTDQGLDSIACRYAPGTSSTVNWDFQSGNSSSHRHFVHVLQNDDLSVTRFTPSGSAANDTNVDITSAGLTNLDSAMIIGTCQGSGGGTAYGRNWRNYRITSLTNAQHYCHRSGNTILHNIQIIDFEAVEDSGGSVSLVVQESQHNHTAEQPVLSHSYSLSLNQSDHSHAAENTTLSHGYLLSLFDAGHDQTSDQTNLTHKYSLSVNEGLHGLISDQPTIIAKYVLTTSESAHNLTSDNVTLSTSNSLSVNSSDHTHQADAPVLSSAYNLSVNNANHGLQSDSVALTFGASLSPNSSLHGHQTEELDLSHSYLVSASAALHGVLSDNLTLSTSLSLSVNYAAHNHTADNVSLFQGYNLTVNETIHGVESEQVLLSPGFDLSVNNTEHLHESEQPVISHAYLLSINDCVHGHTSSDFLSVSQSSFLALASNYHSHAAQSVVIPLEDVILISSIQKEISLESGIIKEVSLESKITKEISI